MPGRPPLKRSAARAHLCLLHPLRPPRTRTLTVSPLPPRTPRPAPSRLQMQQMIATLTGEAPAVAGGGAGRGGRRSAAACKRAAMTVAPPLLLLQRAHPLPLFD